VGFGSNSLMSGKDTYTGWFSGTTPILIDGWAADRSSQPEVDSSSNIYGIAGEKVSGRLTFSFTRLLATTDLAKDYTFALSGTTYVVYAYANTAVRATRSFTFGWRL
jgi:hypothetical protein